MRTWSSVSVLAFTLVALAACGGGPRPTTAQTTQAAKPIEADPKADAERWKMQPPLDSSGFWEESSIIETHPVNGMLQVALLPIFADDMAQIESRPLKEYKSIALSKWIAARPREEVGEGKHLLITNARGERLFLERDDIAKYEPEIVIGIDEEKNLFRLFTTYRLEREYSWHPQSKKPPTMIRTLGAFLFFPQGTPPELEDTSQAGYSLLPSSFRFEHKDSIGFARTLPESLRAALIGKDGCLKCHAFKSASAHAHHMRLDNGKAHGGFALSLDAYPKPVLHTFLFEQHKVAASFGVTPLVVPDRDVAELLFNLAAHSTVPATRSTPQL